MALRAIALALLLMGLGTRLVMAQESAAVVFVAGDGAVCVGGSDVMWADANARIMRWRRGDGALSEIDVPALGHVDVARGVVGCLVRPDGAIDLYYVEAYSVPGTRTDLGGPGRRIQTIWTSGGRHRVLLDIEMPEGGHVQGSVQVVPELGVALRDDLAVERASDGAIYRFELPKDMRLYGAWPASRRWPVDPPELVMCYGYSRGFTGARLAPGGCIALLVGDTPMTRRPLPVDARDINLMSELYYPDHAGHLCTLRAPVDRQYPLRRAAFDCFRNIFNQGPYLVKYPVDNGVAVWRRRLPETLCRQRSVDVDGLVVQAQCFRLEAMVFRPPASSEFSVLKGYEYPSTSGWTVTFVGSDANPPVTARLVPAND